MAVMPIAHLACVVKVKIGNTSNRILSRTHAESAKMVKRVNLRVMTGRVAMNVINAPYRINPLPSRVITMGKVLRKPANGSAARVKMMPLVKQKVPLETSSRLRSIWLFMFSYFLFVKQ